MNLLIKIWRNDKRVRRYVAMLVSVVSCIITYLFVVPDSNADGAEDKMEFLLSKIWQGTIFIGMAGAYVRLLMPKVQELAEDRELLSGTEHERLQWRFEELNNTISRLLVFYIFSAVFCFGASAVPMSGVVGEIVVVLAFGLFALVIHSTLYIVSKDHEIRAFKIRLAQRKSADERRKAKLESLGLTDPVEI